MTQPIIKIKFTKGFGNNLFQYVFCRLLAERQGFLLSHDAIPALNVPRQIYSFSNGLKLRYIKDIRKDNPNGLLNYKKLLKEKLNKNYNYSILGYFEDYTIYKPYLKKIKSWFADIPKNNTKDLALHIRLGDRLLCANSYKDFISPEKYFAVLSSIKFQKLFIVTDIDKWDYIDKKYIQGIRKEERKERRRKKIPPNDYPILSPKKAVNYFNELIKILKEFNPILVNHKKFIDDFNFIRRFDKIIITFSTFAWWAAVLSHANQVGIYKFWRPHKGIRNKNLGKTDYPGWFSWGS